jgi:transcriptional regulator with XRE-family HTH domain
MTPFGEKLRLLRQERNITLKDLAEAIGVSTAYLSALELGQRGRPGWHIVQRIITHFNIIWDEAEELVRLAELSHPKIVIDTSKLNASATELANLLGQKIGLMSEEEIAEVLYILKAKRLNR